MLNQSRSSSPFILSLTCRTACPIFQHEVKAVQFPPPAPIDASFDQCGVLTVLVKYGHLSVGGADMIREDRWRLGEMVLQCKLKAPLDS